MRLALLSYWVLVDLLPCDLPTPVDPNHRRYQASASPSFLDEHALNQVMQPFLMEVIEQDQHRWSLRWPQST